MAVAIIAGQIIGPFADLEAAEAWYATTYAAFIGHPVSYAMFEPVE